ncbi:hypothetical protein QBK99_00970 [Corticibacterium sp. UT-5YL-CI-8]|nr:hypothetical protein [Tianweitania sp. UT-5YL-CI-8]
MRSSLLWPAVLVLALTAPAIAGKTVDLDGLSAVPVEIRNSGAAPILCQAEIAHWFSTDLARIAPGESAKLDLRFNLRSGTWAAMNAQGEALPLERAWCGVEGRTYETRWDLSLARTRPMAQQLDCRAEETGLDCR